jgi:hypothetical protein
VGGSLGSSAHCLAISIARIRAALTATIPRSNRALARRANLGAAKSCSLVINFMIRPPTAKSGNRMTPTDRGLIMARAVWVTIILREIVGCVLC